MSEQTMTGISAVSLPLDKCPIWGTEATVRRQGPIIYLVEGSLRAGGEYVIDLEVAKFLDSEAEPVKARLTTMLVDLRMEGDKAPMTTRDMLERAANEPPLPDYERAQRLLRHLVATADEYGTRISYFDEMALAVSDTTEGEDGIRPLLILLEDRGEIRLNHVIGGMAWYWIQS